MYSNTSKYTNHTKEEIMKYLDNVKESIQRNKFYVCQTEKNEKNIEFIEKYNLSSKKQKEMLLELQVTDFCYSVDNYNNPKERLYVFCKEYELNNWGMRKNVEVYIKMAFKRNSLVVIISFHTPEKIIKRLFV